MSVEDFPTAEPVSQALPTGVVPVAPLSVVMARSDPAIGSDLSLRVIEDKVFLKGATTEQFRKELKQLGGMWNGGLKGWTFELRSQNDVSNFVENIKAGTVKPDPSIGYVKRNFVRHNKNENISLPPSAAVSSGTPFALPTTSSEHILPTINDNFKKAWHLIFQPKVGMTAKISIGSQNMSYPVTKVEVNEKSKAVERAHVQTPNGASILEFAFGHWQVRGVLPANQIHFE